MVRERICLQILWRVDGKHHIRESKTCRTCWCFMRWTGQDTFRPVRLAALLRQNSIRQFNIWSGERPVVCRVPLINSEMVELHRPDRVMRQFGLHQYVPQRCNTCAWHCMALTNVVDLPVLSAQLDMPPGFRCGMSVDNEW